jgi:hypothetical protein
MNEANAVQEIAKVNLWLDLFTWENVGNVAAVLVLIAAVIGFVRAVLSKNNDLNLMDMFAENGKLGGSKMRLNGAWIVTTWALVYLTLSKGLTEWFLTAYLLAFVSDRIFSRKEAKKPDAP